MRTPRDKGRAQASWIMTQDRADFEYVAPEGEYNLAEVLTSAKLGKVYPFSVIYITNNLPYINRLEHGHSKQAPAGMVRVSLVELESELKQIIGS